MQLTLQDLSLFLDCPIQANWKYTAEKNGRNKKGEKAVTASLMADISEGTFNLKDLDIKLKLRPISSLTDDELKYIAKEIFGISSAINIQNGADGVNIYVGEWNEYNHTYITECEKGITVETDFVYSPVLLTKYLMSIQIDVFGWIKKKCAIDATKSEL